LEPVTTAVLGLVLLVVGVFANHGSVQALARALWRSASAMTDRLAQGELDKGTSLIADEKVVRT
jgi:hypothetical protein